jgi:hypothetical protein
MTASILTARLDLAKARNDLDAAERELPESGDDTVMASPALMAVLERVRAAQRLLSHLESVLASEALAANRARAP